MGSVCGIRRAFVSKPVFPPRVLLQLCSLAALSLAALSRVSHILFRSFFVRELSGIIGNKEDLYLSLATWLRLDLDFYI